MAKLSFYHQYFKNLTKTVKNLDLNKIDKITSIILEAINNNNNIFIAGNGGAGSVANHMLCDFNKGIKISSKKKLMPKFISLSSPIEQITAISNDINFKKIFSFQIENYLKKDDVVILLSVSGTSPNIVDILKFLQNKKCKVIFLTGFRNKKLNENVNVYLNLKCKNYGISEDIFCTILHVISQKIRSSFKNRNEIL
jgi:D-sedoheptulose 7-phosphate isomerase